MPAILLTRGLVAVVDDKDFVRLSAFQWMAVSSTEASRSLFYAARAEGKRRLFMHHEILPQRDGVEVDHKNRNGLDNRRSNLRYATHSQQMANRRVWAKSGLRGVRYDPSSPGCKPWRAKIAKDGTEIRLGRFATAEEAARAYDEAAVRLYGEFAMLNYPPPMMV